MCKPNTWNHRVISHIKDGREWLGIHEVHYTADGGNGPTQNPCAPGGLTIELLRCEFERQKRALEKPMLDEDEPETSHIPTFGPGDYRVIKESYSGEDWFSIHMAFSNQNGIEACTDEAVPILGSTIQELREEFDRQELAFEKPILEMDEEGFYREVPQE